MPRGRPKKKLGRGRPRKSSAEKAVVKVSKSDLLGEISNRLFDITPKRQLAILCGEFEDKKIEQAASGIVAAVDQFEKSWQLLAYNLYRFVDLTGLKQVEVQKKYEDAFGKKMSKATMSKLLVIGKAIVESPSILSMSKDIEVVYKLSRQLKSGKAIEELEAEGDGSEAGGKKTRSMGKEEGNVAKKLEAWMKKTRDNVIPFLPKEDTQKKLEAILQEIEQQVKDMVDKKKLVIVETELNEKVSHAKLHEVNKTVVVPNA